MYAAVYLFGWACCGGWVDYKKQTDNKVNKNFENFKFSDS